MVFLTFYLVILAIICAVILSVYWSASQYQKLVYDIFYVGVGFVVKDDDFVVKSFWRRVPAKKTAEALKRKWLDGELR